MKSVLLGCLFAAFSLQLAVADSMKNNSGVSKFAVCSKQCMKENDLCKKKAAKKCGKSDEKCFEACNIVYPDCMAKCPRPGS